MELKVLREEYTDVVRGLNDLCDGVEKEARTFKDNEKEKYDGMISRQKDLKDQIETIERLNQARDLAPPEEVQRVKAPAMRSAARTIEKEGLAMRGWFLSHNNASDLVTDDMRQAAHDLGVSFYNPNFVTRAQTIGTTTEGGHLRTPNAYAGLERSLKWFGGITNHCKVVPSANGNPSFWATLDDTANVGAVVDETDPAVNVAFALSKIDMAYTKFGSGVFPVSNELIRDSEVPIASLVEDMIGERIARKVNTHTTIGNITGNKGFMTTSVEGLETASATAVTIEELITLQHSVDRAYRIDPSTRWYFNDNTHQYLRKLKDGEDRPLLMTDWVNGSSVEKLLGNEIVICNDMENMGADKKFIAYGPASKFLYRPVQSLSFRVLNELYAVNDEVAFIAFLTLSCMLLNPNAIKHGLGKSAL